MNTGALAGWWRRWHAEVKPPEPEPVPYAPPIPPWDLRPGPSHTGPLADAILEDLRRHVLITLVDMWLDYRHEHTAAAVEQMRGAVRGMYLAGLVDRGTRDEWEARLGTEGA